MFHTDVQNLYEFEINPLTHRIDSTVELRDKVFELVGSSAVFGRTGTAMRMYWQDVHGGILNAWQEALAKYISALSGVKGRLEEIDADPQALVFDEHVLDVDRMLRTIQQACQGVDQELRLVAGRVVDCGVDVTGMNLAGTQELLGEAFGVTETTLEEFYRLRDHVAVGSDLAEVERLLDAIEQQINTATMISPSGQIEFNSTAFAATSPGLAMTDTARQAMLDRLLTLPEASQEAAAARFIARGLDRLTPAERWVFLSWLHDERVPHQRVADSILAAFTLPGHVGVNHHGAVNFNMSPLRGSNQTLESLEFLEAHFVVVLSLQARAFDVSSTAVNWSRACEITAPLNHLLAREQLFFSMRTVPDPRRVDLTYFHAVDEDTGQLQGGLARITINDTILHHSRLRNYLTGGTILSGLASADIEQTRIDAARLAEVSPTEVFARSMLLGGASAGANLTLSQIISRAAVGVPGAATAVSVGLMVAGLVQDASDAANAHEGNIERLLDSAEALQTAKVYNTMGYGVRFVYIEGQDPIIRSVNRDTGATAAVMDRLNRYLPNAGSGGGPLTHGEVEHAVRERYNDVEEPRYAAIFDHVVSANNSLRIEGD
jgi:hypothetical protein